MNAISLNKQSNASRRWLVAAVAFLLLFAAFTAVVVKGALLYPTLTIEQWLLHRPLTRIDCVFSEWKLLGETLASLILLGGLGLICFALGYRRRVLFYLVILLLIGAGVETLGKDTYYQPVPISVQNGINSLACPQLWRRPTSVKLLVGLGLWWEAPHPHPRRIAAERASATVPLSLNQDAYPAAGYPSGHALRWLFLGLIACWLSWRWIRRRWLRALLITLALAIGFGGGFSIFYIGQHLFSDLIGGYLLGAALACCAIGLLLVNERPKSVGTDLSRPEAASITPGATSYDANAGDRAIEPIHKAGT